MLFEFSFPSFNTRDRAQARTCIPAARSDDWGGKGYRPAFFRRRIAS